MEARDWNRLAARYHTEIISPFQQGVDNPLPGALRAIRGARRMSAAEFGCGTGSLLPLLASRFARVTAIDFSPQMLARARRRRPGTNVRFVRGDLRDLGAFRQRFDIAVAVNAVLAPDAREVNAILEGIYATLRPGGRLMAVFPAMEPVLYQAMLIYEEEVHAIGEKKRALSRTRRRLERSKFNFELGLYEDSGLAQKFFYEFELRFRLRRAGFRWVRIGKVLYPWDAERIGYELFPGQPRMWDWFVTARRPRPRSHPGVKASARKLAPS
ncbi:MAG: class I SAM-dependent methyltransferase [Myxococcota bacterium]